MAMGATVRLKFSLVRAPANQHKCGVPAAPREAPWTQPSQSAAHTARGTAASASLNLWEFGQGGPPTTNFEAGQRRRMAAAVAGYLHCKESGVWLYNKRRGAAVYSASPSHSTAANQLGHLLGDVCLGCVGQRNGLFHTAVCRRARSPASQLSALARCQYAVHARVPPPSTTAAAVGARTEAGDDARRRVLGLADQNRQLGRRLLHLQVVLVNKVPAPWYRPRAPRVASARARQQR